MFEMLDHNGPGHFGSSFALGFSEPNFVKKPTHPHQSWRPNPRMRSQTSSRRTWPSCTSHWRPSWLGRRSPDQPRQLWAHRDTPGPGIPGWGERVQCPDLGLHSNAPPSGSPGGSQLGPGGQPRGSPSGPGGPDEGAPGGGCLRGHSWNPEAEVGVPRE